MLKKIIMKIINKVQNKKSVKENAIQKITIGAKSVGQTVKRSIKKNSANLVIAVGNSRFFVHGGDVLSHLKDLERALASMSEAQYLYHVSKVKNDFARWTVDILRDSKTAELLKNAKSKTEALKVVTKALMHQK
jgi:hypothetical protein